MPVAVTINNTTYNLPIQGEDPQWGQDLSDYLVAIASVLNTLLSPGDILQTTATINNNISVLANVNGCLFDPSSVRAANITYSIYRTSASNTSGVAEEGSIFLIYDTNASAGSKWSVSQRSNGSAGVSFSITDAGQVQYLSSDIGATSYSGTLKFSAKTLSV